MERTRIDICGGFFSVTPQYLIPYGHDYDRLHGG